MRKLDPEDVMRTVEEKCARAHGFDPFFAAPEVMRECLRSTQVRAAVEAIVECINRALDPTLGDGEKSSQRGPEGP